MLGQFGLGNLGSCGLGLFTEHPLERANNEYSLTGGIKSRQVFAHRAAAKLHFSTLGIGLQGILYDRHTYAAPCSSWKCCSETFLDLPNFRPLLLVTVPRTMRPSFIAKNIAFTNAKEQGRVSCVLHHYAVLFLETS